MAELDIDALKRRPLTCRQGEPDCELWAAHQEAIIAALEDRDRLLRIEKAARVVVARWAEGEGSENDWDNATDALAAALEGRDD